MITSRKDQSTISTTSHRPKRYIRKLGSNKYKTTKKNKKSTICTVSIFYLPLLKVVGTGTVCYPAFKNDIFRGK